MVWSDVFWSIMLGLCITIWSRRALNHNAVPWTFADTVVLTMVLAIAMFSSYKLFID